MILVDTALQRRHLEGNPVRFGLVGAGYIGRQVTRQALTRMQGIQVSAIANRTLANAVRAYEDAGAGSPVVVDSVDALEDAISRGRCAVTSDPTILCEAPSIDAVLEATGAVEYSANVALAALRGHKHLIAMNAELDALVGPYLKVLADRAGVVYTNSDGDQPGVVMNLFRWVQTIGYRPVLAGNIKGMLDFYRTPETQRGYAERYKQDVRMCTSFADGTKLSFEQAVIANATGFGVARAGMYGPACAHVTEASRLFPLERLLEGGIVDYVLGAEPGPGVFVLGYDDEPARKGPMEVYKLGTGPLYVFYVPYHLPHLEPPISVARAVLFHDPVITPIGAPVCEVFATAKRDLSAGETLDGIGGFTCYGVIDNAERTTPAELLPMSLSEGCVLKRDVPRDQPISYTDVDVPAGLLSIALRREQDRHFTGSSPLDVVAVDQVPMAHG